MHPRWLNSLQTSRTDKEERRAFKGSENPEDEEGSQIGCQSSANATAAEENRSCTGDLISFHPHC